MQVEGIAVVSKRHPCPVSQGVGALARVGPLVDQTIIFNEKTVLSTSIGPFLNNYVLILCTYR